SRIAGPPTIVCARAALNSRKSQWSVSGRWTRVSAIPLAMAGKWSRRVRDVRAIFSTRTRGVPREQIHSPGSPMGVHYLHRVGPRAFRHHGVRPAANVGGVRAAYPAFPVALQRPLHVRAAVRLKAAHQRVKVAETARNKFVRVAFFRGADLRPSRAAH